MLALLWSCFCKCSLTTVETLFIVMPFAKQYLLNNQASNCFDPLLALQDPQHRAIFSDPFILISLTICSHVALDLNERAGLVNIIPQYTQCRSLSFTNSSTFFGIHQRLAIAVFLILYKCINVRIRYNYLRKQLLYMLALLWIGYYNKYIAFLKNIIGTGFINSTA